MQSEVAGKIAQYEAFANDVLKRDLSLVTEQRQQLQAEVQEWEELGHSLQQLQQQQGRPRLKALVDLGGGVHCQARVPDASRVCLEVGLGFHLECELGEAQRVVQLRVAHLRARLDRAVARAAQIRRDLAFVKEGIAELAALG